jgi:formate hydrogenlyase subunit 3/multisubunit Na+/H+ antiporter MnhD subunit
MPLTAFVFILAALSLAAVPPLGAFVGQILLISTLFGLASIWPLVFYGLTLVLTVLYLLRLFRGVFLGRLGLSQAGERSRFAAGMLVILLALVVGAGLMPFWAINQIEPVVNFLLR